MRGMMKNKLLLAIYFLKNFHIWRYTFSERSRYGMEMLYITYLPDAYFSFAVVARKR